MSKSFLDFIPVEAPAGRKTNMWRVVNSTSKIGLGFVQWFSQCQWFSIQVVLTKSRIFSELLPTNTRLGKRNE